MSNNENSQLYSKEKEKSNKNENKNQQKIEVELVLKGSKNNESIKNISPKNDMAEEQLKNNELILPKIENNNPIKQEDENNNIDSKSQENLENINNIEKEKNIDSSFNNKIESDLISKNTNNTFSNIEKLKEKEEKIVKTFKKLKKAIMLTCVEIEDNLNRIYYPENTEEMMNLSHVNFTKTSKFSRNNKNELTEEQKEKEKEIFKKIKNYKSKIKSIQNELDITLKINKADELETIYTQKKIQLEKLKKENMALKNVKSIKEKDKVEIDNKNAQKNALYSMNEKINKIKGETKIKKDYCHTLIEKIKCQNEKINELQKKCDLINENMKYYKKKQIQELKMEKEKELYTIEEQKDIKTLKDNYQKEYSKIKEKQEKLNSKIKEQNTQIKSISKHNDNLTEKIREIIIEIKDKSSQIISYENRIKIKEKEIYGKINKKNNTLSDRKPFHVTPVLVKTQKKKKIFDYQRYLKDYENKNKIKNRMYTSADNSIKPKTLNEIENLKNDIQKTIKKNELDEKIKKIISELKSSGKFNQSNIKNEEEDELQKILNKNQGINYSDRYNFYVTEGANLPVPLKAENINNYYSNY